MSGEETTIKGGLAFFLLVTAAKRFKIAGAIEDFKTTFGIVNGRKKLAQKAPIN